MTKQNHETPINATVDFERAKERLEAAAGRLFNEYRSAKTGGHASEEEVERLRAAYVVANDRAKDLRATDKDAIAAVLGAAE